MKGPWIDFKALRESLDFETVLEFYKVEIKRKGEQHHGFCPLPNHNGKRNSVSFSANLKRGIFQCFGCGARGNILEFAAFMDNIDPTDGAALREVALKLQKRFCLTPQEHRGPRKVVPVDKAPQPAKSAAQAMLRAINPPLDFELKGLDQNHPYLRNRGFTTQTIQFFELGFCSRGLLKDRIAIPLRERNGSLVGYAGRVVDDSLVTADNPRYRFPGERNRNNVILDFRKTLFLYNGFRIKGPVDDLFVVEGFSSVWWLTQEGLPNVVATMGADCSDRQAELIVSAVNPNGRVWIISDGDKAGLRHSRTILTLVSPHRFVRWIKLPEGKQPTDFSIKDLGIK